MGGKIIGIDLGTTNSCAAVLEGRKPIVIQNNEGSRTTPSVVAWQDGTLMVGQAAKRQAVTHSEGTVYAMKRFIGKKYGSNEVQQIRMFYPFELCEAENGDIQVLVRSRKCSPTEILSVTLEHLKQAAEDQLCENITDAVITVPTCFNYIQRQAIKKAGEIAGLNVLRILNDTSAVAMAYGLNKNKDEKIAIIDLGGGNFDISIIELGGGVFEVKSTNGDTNLGGDDFDKRLMDALVSEIEKKSGPISERTSLNWIREAAESAKRDLSSAMETIVNPPLAKTGRFIKPIAIKLTRSKIETLVQDLVRRLITPCQTAIRNANIDIRDIDKVILVGGMARMPCIQKQVAQIFGKEPYMGMNTGETVALGAAIEGGILAGQVKDILRLDVMPFSIGIENQDGFMERVIEKDTTIPIKRSKILSVTTDDNRVANIHVLAGEWSAVADNVSLGRFYFPAHRRDNLQIEVSLDIDANQSIHVSAKEIETGKEHLWRIQ